jgi:hypothetical protein
VLLRVSVGIEAAQFALKLEYLGIHELFVRRLCIHLVRVQAHDAAVLATAPPCVGLWKAIWVSAPDNQFVEGVF